MIDSAGSSRADSVVYDWWRRLNPEDSQQSGHQRAALARLRRATTAIEVMQEPEALRLIARLPRNPERVAVLAGILAFVRETDDRRVARAVGRTALDDDKSALLSESRFRRLLQTSAGDLLAPMRRLVRMNKGTCNVRDLTNSILYWGDRVKKRWIFDYYAVAMAASDRSSGAPASDRSEPREFENV